MLPPEEAHPRQDEAADPWRRRSVLVAAAIAALFLASVSATNPPGFSHDEANIAFNAATIAGSGRDEHGARLPMYFSSIGDWKSGPYIYLLAGVFTVTGPDKLVARTLSATLGLLAVGMLGLLGLRLSGRASVALATATLAAATPWIFEVTRLVFEVALEPLLLATLLYVVAGGRDERTWSLGRCVCSGLLLALIAYAYAGGRPLALLLALSLAVFATRERLRSVLLSWASFAVALVPMGIFAARHPHALFVRYEDLSTVKGKGFADTLATWAGNFVHAGSVWQWTIFGDRSPQHHVQGSGGDLLVVGVLLAIGGIGVVTARRRWDAFWAFVVLGAFVSIIPAALTTPHPHALRAIGLPVFLTALAVPALEAIRTNLHRPAVRTTAAAAALAATAQFAFFETVYWHDGPRRRDTFDGAFPRVYDAAVASGRPVAFFRPDWNAVEDGEWYARLRGDPLRILDAGERPPRGAVVVTTGTSCPACPVVADGGIFRAYVSTGL